MNRFVKLAILVAILITGGLIVASKTHKRASYGEAVKAYKASITEATKEMKSASVESSSSIRSAGPGDSSVVIESVDQLVERHRAQVDKVRATVDDVKINGEEKIKAAKTQLTSFHDPATKARVQAEISIFEKRLGIFLNRAEAELNAANIAMAAARERVVAAALISDLRAMETTIASAEQDLGHCQQAITAMASIELPSESVFGS